eukprot:CAMPEP_0119049086 /NCGR_PEP_ID=MMETSP1177-20130426/62700_1 /TAXON_ID=2985 /ORGANISM="Ochromonas sp, Strain CCMP1899" /LENGTH=78 /DNA_ID=CAMNT_0007025863 /DNA_START=971 /DNA_END=1206 /DNA_ORIENTATION=-
MASTLLLGAAHNTLAHGPPIPLEEEEEELGCASLEEELGYASASLMEVASKADVIVVLADEVVYWLKAVMAALDSSTS